MFEKITIVAIPLQCSVIWMVWASNPRFTFFKFSMKLLKHYLEEKNILILNIFGPNKMTVNFK
jgi:hypothetical protein